MALKLGDVRYWMNSGKHMARRELFRVGPLTDLGSSPCHTAVDLAAKSNKIDRLCEKCLGTAFQGFSLGLRIAVGGDHDDGDVRARSLGLRQELKS